MNELKSLIGAAKTLLPMLTPDGELHDLKEFSIPESNIARSRIILNSAKLIEVA